MKNTIWSNEELKQIRSIFKAKLNINIDEDNNIEVVNKNKYIIGDGIKDNGGILINELCDITTLLLTYVNKSEIDEIIKKYHELAKKNYDKNNKLHYGLINTLLNLNTDTSNACYYTQIFIIVRELIYQYNRIIKLVVDNSLKNITNPNSIRLKQIEIKRTKISLEERKVSVLLQKIFYEIPGFSEEPLFNMIIKNCDGEIKKGIIKAINQKLEYSLSQEMLAKEIDARLHQKDFNDRFRKTLKQSIKNNNGYVYGRNKK